MKKVTLFLIKGLSIVMTIAIAAGTFTIINEKLPDQYDKTFLAEFQDKYRLLNSTNDKKIIVVGGSSVPFGVNSKLIDEAFPEYRVVNYGLYASLGTKFMMDTTKSNLRSGDIVILSPEVNEETYSLFFNPDVILQACDGIHPSYKYVGHDNCVSLYYHYFKFAFNKMNYYATNSSPNPVGIYRHDSFNQYGDIEVERSKNIMNQGVDINMKIKPTTDLINDEFINYVNKYIDFATKKGSKVFFNFSPCNNLAIYSSKDKRNEFENTLHEKIKTDFLLSLNEATLDYRYFFDTNFHLNSVGMELYTKLLIKGLKMKLGMEYEEDIDVAPPNSEDDENIPEVIPTVDDVTEYNGDDNIDYVDYFEYQQVGSSYAIKTIKDEYKGAESIILPSIYHGKRVTSLTSEALDGCKSLTDLYIGKSYKSLEAGCFKGCENLSKIYLFKEDGNSISVPSSGLLDGASEDVKIYIPENSNYVVGYTWMNYRDYFVYFKVQ